MVVFSGNFDDYNMLPDMILTEENDHRWQSGLFISHMKTKKITINETCDNKVNFSVKTIGNKFSQMGDTNDVIHEQTLDTMNEIFTRFKINYNTNLAPDYKYIDPINDIDVTIAADELQFKNIILDTYYSIAKNAYNIIDIPKEINNIIAPTLYRNAPTHHNNFITFPNTTTYYSINHLNNIFNKTKTKVLDQINKVKNYNTRIQMIKYGDFIIHEIFDTVQRTPLPAILHIPYIASNNEILHDPVPPLPALPPLPPLPNFPLQIDTDRFNFITNFCALYPDAFYSIITNYKAVANRLFQTHLSSLYY